MKKTLSMILALTLCLSLSLIFTACGHEHSFATDWSKDATHHWHACTEEGCTEVADKAEHTFDAGTVTTPATNTTAGTKTFTCSVCAATKTEPYSAVTTIADDTAWAAAFDLGTNWVLRAVATVDTAVMMDYTTERNGNLLKETSIEGTESSISFEAIKGDKFYRYTTVKNGSNEVIGYKESDLTENYASADEFAASWSGNFLEPFGNRADFTYNETTKAYEAESLYGGMMTAVSIGFADGKVVTVTYKTAMVPSGTMIATCVLTVTLGNASAITLPTNIVTP